MNNDLRQVVVESMPTYRTDNGAGIYKFTLKRYYSGKDLSTLNAYLKIKFQDESTDKILLKNITSDDENVTAIFEVSNAFSRVSGDAECQLCFENVDGSITVNSRIFTVEILDSIEVESYGQTVLPSAIRLLQTKLQEKIEEMNAKIETLNGCITTVNAVIASESFVNREQLLTVPCVTENSVVTFSPVDNADVFGACGLYLSSQGEGYVGVKYTVKPASDFVVRFLVVNKPGAVSLG